MNFQKVLDTVLKKEMTRKEFLGMIGMGIISMIGISSMLKNVADSFGKHTGAAQPTGLDYGDSSYGGNSGRKPNSLL